MVLGDILAGNVDGMYVLTEPYPPLCRLFDSEMISIPAGPASLADPLVLEAALRDRAKSVVSAGVKLMEKARHLEADDREQAQAIYLQAMHEFDLADALLGDVARSYKIETTRRQIAMLRQGTDELASSFDAELADLGKHDVSQEAYSEKVRSMAEHLRSIQHDLDAILTLAQVYPQEMSLVIQWAHSDRLRIAAMQQTLLGELDDAK